MIDSIPLLASALAFVYSSRYLLLFFACFFEGTLAMAAGGILWSIGAMPFWPMYLTLLSADIAADTCWYAVGAYGTRTFVERWGRLIGIRQGNLARAEARFKRYDVWIIFLSKLTMGFGLAIPTLVAAGMLHIPYPRFLAINTAGSVIWVLVVVLAGAYLGGAFFTLPAWAQIALGAAGIAAILLIFRFAARRPDADDEHLRGVYPDSNRN